MSSADRPILMAAAVSLCALGLCACKVFAHDFDATKDELALATVLTRFESTQQQPALSLTVCEDEPRAAAAVADGCDVAHLVRGGGLSKTDRLEHLGGGCGGCPLENVAMIKARLAGGGLAHPIQLVGKAVLGNGYRGDPYAPPYRLTLESARGEVSLELEVRDSKTHALRLFSGPLGQGQVPHDFESAGAATCPLPPL